MTDTEPQWYRDMQAAMWAFKESRNDQPFMVTPLFYNAATHVPANERHVLSYREERGHPFHSIVSYANGLWQEVSDGEVTVVERWCELPYPGDAMPPHFDVKQFTA